MNSLNKLSLDEFLTEFDVPTEAFNATEAKLLISKSGRGKLHMLGRYSDTTCGKSDLENKSVPMLDYFAALENGGVCKKCRQSYGDIGIHHTEKSIGSLMYGNWSGYNVVASAQAANREGLLMEESSFAQLKSISYELLNSGRPFDPDDVAGDIERLPVRTHLAMESSKVQSSFESIRSTLLCHIKEVMDTQMKIRTTNPEVFTKALQQAARDVSLFVVGVLTKKMNAPKSAKIQGPELERNQEIAKEISKELGKLCNKWGHFHKQSAEEFRSGMLEELRGDLYGNRYSSYSFGLNHIAQLKRLDSFVFSGENFDSPIDWAEKEWNHAVDEISEHIVSVAANAVDQILTCDLGDLVTLFIPIDGGYRRRYVRGEDQDALLGSIPVLAVTSEAAAFRLPRQLADWCIGTFQDQIYAGRRYEEHCYWTSKELTDDAVEIAVGLYTRPNHFDDVLCTEGTSSFANCIELGQALTT